MLTRSLTRATLAAALGGALWAFAPAPASAMMSAAPLTENAVPTQVEQAYWVRRWHRRHYWRRHYWRRNCWRGYYGRLHCGY